MAILEGSAYVPQTSHSMNVSAWALQYAQQDRGAEWPPNCPTDARSQPVPLKAFILIPRNSPDKHTLE